MYVKECESKREQKSEGLVVRTPAFFLFVALSHGREYWNGKLYNLCSTNLLIPLNVTDWHGTRLLNDTRSST